MAEIDDQFPDFRGKIVMFYLANQSLKQATPVESPIFEHQAERLFVVGVHASGVVSHWAEGLKISIAWDQVQQYIVFDSRSDYEQRVVNRRRKKGGMFQFIRR